jgi:hypothetical protein
MDVWMDGWIMDGRVDGWRHVCLCHGRMDGWMDGCVDASIIDGWMDGWSKEVLVPDALMSVVVVLMQYLGSS